MAAVVNSRVLFLCSVYFFGVTISTPFNSNRHTGDLGEPGKNLVPNEYNRFYLFFARESEEDESTESTDIFTTDTKEEAEQLAPYSLIGVPGDYVLLPECLGSPECPEGNDSPIKRVDPDPLSVVWYLGAFSGLIIFFLVVTFSEWCCASKHLYRSGGPAPPPYSGQGYSRTPETPPPPYHLFAPPPYKEAAEKMEPIYIIPVHQPVLPSSTRSQ